MNYTPRKPANYPACRGPELGGQLAVCRANDRVAYAAAGPIRLLLAGCSDRIVRAAPFLYGGAGRSALADDLDLIRRPREGS